jgi:hypothetical protein
VKHVLVVLDREHIELKDPALEPGSGLVLARPLGHLDAGHLGQDPKRLGERHLLPQLDEREDVAAPIAAETEPGLELLVDPEARGLLLVEGAEPDPLPAPLAQTHVLLDDVDQVEPGPDLVPNVLQRLRHRREYPRNKGRRVSLARTGGSGL